MKLTILNTYQELSAAVAEQVTELMSGRENPLLCPASGDTPAGLYKVLVEKYKDRKSDVSQWGFVGLDEWVGLNGSDEGSCRYSIDKELLLPLNISGDKICFFDGRATALQQECEAAERFIAQYNGIDVAILGLGMNGHIAMNEPGCAADGRAQIVTLHPVTMQVGQKYFNQPQVLKEGITLGLGTLLESRHIILMVSGKHKAGIVKKMLEEPPTNELPGSLLLNHSSVTIFLDADAAALLSNIH
ncbi:glucosamine-6-phosphate deaminase [Chitinophaga sp. CC14]|uniref:glucosamine-6-phosphate deaminase n=1 Tax=Chitinophaga sp. CC14 TaxID=3029199 RepID=UPI003B78BF4C